MKRRRDTIAWSTIGHFLFTLLIAGILAFTPFLIGTPTLPKAYAATTQDVTVNATPSYISISNSPANWNAGVITASTDVNTGNGYFTITNSSTVAIDISFYVATANWTSTGSDWNYGAPAENTGQLKVSSADGGIGGSSGAGTYDITLLTGSGNELLVMDNVGTSTNPTWESELDAPSSFTHGDAQSANITASAVAN